MLVAFRLWVSMVYSCHRVCLHYFLCLTIQDVLKCYLASMPEHLPREAHVLSAPGATFNTVLT